MMNKNKKFDVVAIMSIIFICIGFTSLRVTNDTFYTIKVGNLIMENGIDMLDHFSWIGNLPYTYPHWLYDVFISLLFKVGRFRLLYISNIVFYSFIGMMIYFISKRRSNNYLFSFVLTILTLGFLMPFIVTRAQLISFIIFILEKYFIDKFLETGDKRDAFAIVLLSLILVNVHLATWIFFFILFLPSIASHYLTLLVKRIKKNKKDFAIGRLEGKTYQNAPKLFPIIGLCLLMGLLTPLGLTAYTYIFKQFAGDTLGIISEYQNTTIANGFSFFQYIFCFILLFILTDQKISLDDFFLFIGLVFMSLTSIRSFAYLLIIGSFVVSNYLGKINGKMTKSLKEKLDNIFHRRSELLTIFICFMIIGVGLCYVNNSNDQYISEKLYPVDATEYLKKELKGRDVNLFNGYDFGSYLLYNDVKVFIDSRSDLYTRPFNRRERDIFNDYVEVIKNLNYEEIFDYYDITHVLLYKDSDVMKLLKKDNRFQEIYVDEYFSILERQE